MKKISEQISWKALLAVFKVKRIVSSWFSFRRLDFDEANISIRTNNIREFKTRANSCKKEPETCAWLKEHVKEGVVFYDIGANVGAYALIGGVLGAKVYAFEPSPENYATLQENVRRNKLVNSVFPVPVVLSSESGVSKFSFDEFTSGATAGFSREGGGKVEVSLPAIRLDACIKIFNLPTPHAMKIDVDGAEGEVLSGAEKLLKEEELTELLVEVEDKLLPEVLRVLTAAEFKEVDRFTRHEGVYNIVFSRT